VSPTDSLAIIGLGCRFPGANSLDAFISLLSEGAVSIAEIPEERLNRRLFVGKAGELGKTYCTLGGVVPDQPDDPALRDFDPALLADYDQPYRHLLATAVAAVASTNCDPAALGSRRVGVFVGHARGSLQAARLACATWIEDTIARLEQMPLWRELPEALRKRIGEEVVVAMRASSPRRKAGGAPFITPYAGIRLLPRALGWSGPVAAIDAACASSLQALAVAERAIRFGECDIAMVGGASYNNLHSLILFSQAQALSSRGSFPFDTRADGFIGSDGYATVLVTTPDIAAELGATVHAVIRSIGESCDGRGKSLWAPRMQGQVLAMERAWHAGLDRNAVGYIEAHATSTPLGDATELEAMAECFRDVQTPIPIGSVKANIGHTREAAGLSSLIKVILAMRDGRIPHSPYVERLQDGFDWTRAPFFVPRSSRPWPSTHEIRRACINSFGIGGLNVHVVVDDRLSNSPARIPRTKPDDAAIVGRGCVLPSATGIAAFERLLRSSSSAIGNVPEDRWNAAMYCDSQGDPAWRTKESRGGFVRNYSYDWRRHKTPPKQIEHADPLQFWVLDAAGQALEEAGCSGLDRSRIAVIAGTIFGGDFINQLSRCLHHPEFEQILRARCREAGVASDAIIAEFRERFLADIPLLQDDTGGFTASTLASRVARTFDLMGGAFSVDSGESSSEAALNSAAAMLRSGELDAVLVIGAQRLMDMTGYITLAAQGRNVIPGEGAGAVVLRRAADARRDQVRVFRTVGGLVKPGIAASRVGHALGASGMVTLLESTLTTAKRRLVFIFGGQGAQYSGMLRQLVEQSTVARNAMNECDRALAAVGQPSYCELAWDDEGSLGSDVLRTQLAVLCADTILYRGLMDLGVCPDVVAGYSYGDFAALVAAGSITFEQAVAITVERCRFIEDSDSDGLLVVVPMSSHRALEAARLHGDSWISIENGPDQTVIGGRADTMRAFAAQSGGRVLNVPRPYHTPLLEGAAARFRECLSRQRLLPARTPFFASVDGKYLSDPDDIRDYLVRHLTSTVRYAHSVERLAAECESAFVEVGPRSALTALHRRLLGLDAVTAPTDAGSRSGVESLQHVKNIVYGAPEIIEFDATRSRRERNTNAAARQTVVAALAEADELTTSLVRFVCEQTGYPEELVELDADLEADLGIDSIKKAQLLGEMRERYGFAVAGVKQISLADFPTLRSIREFIERNGGKQTSGAAFTPTKNVTSKMGSAPGTRDTLLELTGSHYEIGLEHARRKQHEIEAILAGYYQLAGAPALSDDRLIAMTDRAERLLGHSGLAELQGIAKGLNRPLLELLTYNVALCPDYLPGCSQFVSTATGGFVHAANEDSGLALHLRGILKPFAQVRRPARQIPHLLFTLPGRVGGLNGMNRAGLCVTSALLLDRPVPDENACGVFHPVLVQKVLSEAETLDDAVRIVRSTARVGAWSMMVSCSGVSRYIEYDCGEIRESDTTAACTNHALLLDGGTAPEHSIFRLARLGRLLERSDSRTFEGASSALRDLFDDARSRVVTHATMNTIRRVDNLYSALFLPESGEAWWTSGSGDFERINARELLSNGISSQPRCVLRAVEDGTKSSLPPSIAIEGSVDVLGWGAGADSIRTALARYGLKITDSAEHLILLAGHHEPDKYSEAAVGLHTTLQARIKGLRTITAVTGMGGDFGFGHPTRNAFGGAIAGLLKAVRREHPEVHIRVIDFPGDEPPALIAEAVCAELASPARQIEIGYSRRNRMVVRATPERARAIANPGIESGGTWVISGGARGITALVAEELHRRYRLRLHVLGTAERADLPYARYHRCDVSHSEAVARALDAIRMEGAPIRGILHGAGFESASAFLNKDLANVRRTVDVKVKGALNLLNASQQDPLSHFLAFASISGRFGGFGQSDYAMASDLLAKLMQRIRAERPEVRSVAFHWPAWDETGMAMRPESKLVLELAGHAFLPAQQGVQHVIDELEAGCPEAEILIAFGAEPLDTDSIIVRGPAHDSPLIDRVLERNERIVTETRLDPIRHPFIRDHRWRSSAMLPAAAMIELLMQGTQQGTVEKFEVLNPLVFDSRPIRVRTAVEKCGSAVIYSELRNTSGKLIDPRRTIASAVLAKPAALALRSDEHDAEWHPIEYADEAVATAEGRVYFGETMRVLREFAAAPGGAFARGLAPADDPIPMLDACFVACGIYCRRKFKDAVLVEGVGRLVRDRAARAGEPLTIRLWHRGSAERIHSFDLVMTGSNGHVLIQAAGVRLITTGVAAHA
jgi:acyl transferase domain-containing protein/short-subunit dehydrogenase/acyl carrier protein